MEKASKAAAKRENRGKGLKKAARPPRAAGKAHPAPAAGRKQLEHLDFGRILKERAISWIKNRCETAEKGLDFFEIYGH